MLRQAEEALKKGDGQTALQLVDQVLEADECNWEAWYIAMQCFQMIYPADVCEASGELESARYAIRFAPKEKKYRVRKQVYLFLMERIIAVLKRSSEVLSDGRELLSEYQRLAYFDASGAPKKTREMDTPVLSAVQHSFVYCQALFEAIPDSAIRRNSALNDKAAEVAQHWQQAVNYLALRMGLYRYQLTRENVQDALRIYGRYLRAVKNKEQIMQKTVAFNTLQVPQMPYLQP